MSSEQSGPASAPLASRRFGQLTYTSVDGQGLGGWQIKDLAGLNRAEQELLRSRIDPVLDPGAELPRFPAPHEVAQLPRRLVFGRVRLPAPEEPSGLLARVQDAAAETGIAWWHHAPAGLDGSGRPGNVFTHVLLDRQPHHLGASERPTRPVARWRSGGWLTPYGAEAVRDSVLPATPPPPAAGSGIEGVVSFLLDASHYRLGVLAVLVDACAAALAGGRPVALATQDTDQAASWIAAVSHLMAATTAERLSFSTLERGASIRNRLREGVLLCCFPALDYDQVLEQKGDDVVLLAEDDDVDLGDLDGEPHVTAAGDEVVVTEWSVLAKVALINEVAARRALVALDLLTERLRVDQEPDGLVGEPGWPLALVVATQPDELSDALGEAGRVLLRRGVLGLRADLELRQSVQTLVDRVSGTEANLVWQALEPLVRAHSPLADAAEPLLERYVVCAVRDEPWLAQDGGPPAPPTDLVSGWRPSAGCLDAARMAITDLGVRSADDVDAAVALVRLANFLAQLGLLGHDLGEDLEVGLERGVVHRLLAADGEPGDVAFVSRCGGVAEPVLERLRALLNDKLNEIREVRTRQVLGRFVAAEVLRWLYPEPPPQLWLDQVRSLNDVRLRAEVARLLALEDPEAHAHERQLVLVMALEEAWQEPELEPFLAGRAWTLDQLVEIERQSPAGLPLGVFAGPFLSAPDEPRLERLATELPGTRFLRRRSVDPSAEAVLKMRQRGQQQWWRHQQSFLQNLGDVLTGACHALDYPEHLLHPDLVGQLQGAMLMAALRGACRDELRQLLSVAELSRSTPRRAVWEMLGARSVVAVPLDCVILVAVIGEPDFPEALADRGEKWAARLQTRTASGSVVPMLRHYVQQELSDGRDVDRLIEQLERQLQELRGVGAIGDRASRPASRFLQSWLRSVTPGSSLLGRLWGNQ